MFGKVRIGNICERLMHTLQSKKFDEEKIKRIVGNAVATESFEFLTVTDQEIEELERLALGDITMDDYLKSGCDVERNEP